MALAGPDGLAARLGDELVELECNPVLVTPAGAIALDARSSCATHPPRSEPPPPTDFTRLFAPRAIAVAGASRRGAASATARSRRTARSVGATVSTHCTRKPTEIDGVPAVADLARSTRRSTTCWSRYPRHVVPTSSARLRAGAVRARDQRRLRRGRRRGCGVERRLARGPHEVKNTSALGPTASACSARPGGKRSSSTHRTRAGTVSVVSQSGGLSGDIVIGGTRRGVAVLEGAQRRQRHRRHPGRGARLAGRRPRHQASSASISKVPAAPIACSGRCVGARSERRSCCSSAGGARRERKRSRRTPARSPANAGSGRRWPARAASRWCAPSRNSWPSLAYLERWRGVGEAGRRRARDRRRRRRVGVGRRRLPIASGSPSGRPPPRCAPCCGRASVRAPR